MFEFIRHALGLCGEPHISMLTILAGGFAFIVAWVPYVYGYFLTRKIKKPSHDHGHGDCDCDHKH
jgi:hypothetical protein